MNRNILLALCASCLFLLIGCDGNKYELENIVNPTMTVYADASLGCEVKTSISYDDLSGYSSDWEETDVLGFYYLTEGDATSAPANRRGQLQLGSLSEGHRGSFTGSITKPDESTEFVFNAFYPSSASSGDEPFKLNRFRFTVLGEQNPVCGGIDPKADVLIARPVKKTISPTDESVSLDFSFERVVSIMRISFPTISYDGISPDEKILQVTVSKETSDGNKNGNIIAGRVQVDPSAQTWSLSNFSNGASYNLHSITASYTPENAPTLAEGNVYITLIPRTLSEGDKLIVKVVTDKHNITKTSIIPVGKTLDFPANAVKHVKVSIDQANSENLEVESLVDEFYTKVTDISQITPAGQYILVYDNGATGMVATSISNKQINAQSINYVADKGYRVSDVEAYDVRFEDAGNNLFYIKVVGKYVVYSGDSTNLVNSVSETKDESAYKWSISVGADGALTILSAADNSRWLKYSTSGYFKAYGLGASYKNPKLYVHP